MEEANSPGTSSSNQAENIPKKKQKIKFSHLLVFLLVLSVVINIFLVLKGANISGASFKFIEPSIEGPVDSNVQDEKVIIHYNGLRVVLEEKIEQYSSLENVGLFVQDIETGAWTGINERGGFHPASLLKIPIMMAILRKVELNEMSLEDKIEIISSDADDQYGELYKKVGEQMSVQELLEAMITFSDNTAKDALKRKLSVSELDTIFRHVGIPNPYLAVNSQTVSPREYARIFRALYYSTFLSPDSSEMALRLATDTQEESLISKGIPPNVQVAHKFGIMGTTSLHDCGIVYHPKNPYFICVMTKNMELDKSSKLIYEISKEVFEFVD